MDNMSILGLATQKPDEQVLGQRRDGFLLSFRYSAILRQTKKVIAPSAVAMRTAIRHVPQIMDTFLSENVPLQGSVGIFRLRQGLAGNARKSVASPSAIVGWTRIASRNAV